MEDTLPKSEQVAQQTSTSSQASATSEPQQKPLTSTCTHLAFKLAKNFQIILILAEFALTILYIRNDANESNKCISEEAKTKILIILCISQLFFGIVMILNNFHKFYNKVLLTSACSIVIYLNLRYVYLYILYINIHAQQNQSSSTQNLDTSSCYLPLWLDLATLGVFHIFLIQLYFYIKYIDRNYPNIANPQNSALNEPMPLPTYKEVAKHPNKYPVCVVELPAPAYNDSMNTEVKNTIESV